MAGPGGSGQSIDRDTQVAIDAARKAGFSGLPLVTIVAIARAESGLNPTARNINTDGSVDRGILQFNSRWHPEVSDSCADTPDCAFQAAYRVSSQGTNFNAWQTYKDGKQWAYVSYIGQLAGVTIPPDWKNNESNAQNRNLPAYAGAQDAISGLTPNFDWKRIAVGIFGGLILTIGLLMFVKQLTGMSITGVPGKVGKVLALA